MASLAGLTTGTNVGQRAAAHATARLLGDGLSLKFLPTPGEDELWVVLPETHHQLDLARGEQVLSQILGRRVWITQDDVRYDEGVSFPSVDR